MTKSRAEPLWITQAREVYRRMHELSEVNEYGERLYEGNVVELFVEICGTMSNYGRIFDLLKAHDALRLVRRGNRYQPTLVELTGDAEKIQRDSLLPPEHLTPSRHDATLASEIESRLVPAVKSLQAWRESLERGGLDVAKVLQDYELRITKLEREVQRLGKKTQVGK